ncbi:MAG: class II aldolase/adducin family protein [Chloroflexota bacterium]
MNLLRLSSFATERDLRLAIIEAGRICYESGLMHANFGNISMRSGVDRLVITPSGLCKGRLDPEDLLVMDFEGAIIKANSSRKHHYSSEAALHLEVYKQRDDIRAVIHAHPISATALTVAGEKFPIDVLYEVMEGVGPVPVTQFSKPSPQENALAIKDLIRGHHGILIRNHGVITYGRDLEEALNYLEQIESVAKIMLMAKVFGKVNQLPGDITSDLLKINKKTG